MRLFVAESHACGSDVAASWSVQYLAKPIADVFSVRGSSNNASTRDVIKCASCSNRGSGTIAHVRCAIFFRAMR